MWGQGLLSNVLSKDCYDSVTQAYHGYTFASGMFLIPCFLAEVHMPTLPRFIVLRKGYSQTPIEVLHSLKVSNHSIAAASF